MHNACFFSAHSLFSACFFVIKFLSGHFFQFGTFHRLHSFWWCNIYLLMISHTHTHHTCTICIIIISFSIFCCCSLFSIKNWISTVCTINHSYDLHNHCILFFFLPLRSEIFWFVSKRDPLSEPNTHYICVNVLYVLWTM